MAWLLVLMLIGLQIFMKAPVWYLIGRVKIFSASTSYHRAELLNQAFEHFGEWWACGTDVTRHWMPTGVAYNEDMADITSEYVATAVAGGLPLVLCLGWLLWVAGRSVSGAFRQTDGVESGLSGLSWIAGCLLVAIVLSFVSISWFDQCKLFYAFTLAVIGCLHAWVGGVQAVARPVAANLEGPLDSEMTASFPSE